MGFIRISFLKIKIKNNKIKNKFRKNEDKFINQMGRIQMLMLVFKISNNLK